MERIRTRIYHKLNGKMYPVCMIQEVECEGPYYWFKENNQLLYATPKDVIVMNQIPTHKGLVYEGDIVRVGNLNNIYVNKETLGVVGYDKNAHAFLFLPLDSQYLMPYTLSGKEIYVEGNVFENPELIKCKDSRHFTNVIRYTFDSDYGDALAEIHKKVRFPTRFVLTEVMPNRQEQSDKNLQTRYTNQERWYNTQAKREQEREKKKKMRRYKVYLEVKKELGQILAT